MAILKAYYQLTKPGIIYSNTIAAAAGFLLAARGHVNIWLLFEMILGIALIIASACVYNNYMDQEIDKKMKRTAKRALVTGEISGKAALIFATILGIVGFGILIVFTNWVTVLVGIIGGVDYLLFYGIGKRKSVHGTLIGSISGAMPPVAGYAAVVGRFDIAMILLFLMWVCWQMIHFYAIAIYREKDYASASIPVLPVKKGIAVTKIQMIFYAVLFVLANSLLTIFHYAGYVYLIGISMLGLFWVFHAIKGLFASDSIKWARSFLFLMLRRFLAMSMKRV